VSTLSTILASFLIGKIIDEVFAKSERFEKYKGSLEWLIMAIKIFKK